MLNKEQVRHMMAKLRRFRHQHFTTEHGHTDWKKIAILTVIAFGSFIIFCAILFAASIAILSIGLPDVRDLDKLSVAQSTTIYDREGNVLYVKFGAENREYKNLSQISKNLVNATIAIEDDQFYSHPGFDMFGLARAVFKAGQAGGGSTITQQYIKLTFLSSEKSLIRKVKELILAVRMEEAFDKDTILEKYLNKIPYGNNAYGAEKAAQVYFDKHASELTLAESAILAAIPQAPSHYNPYGQYKFTKLAKSLDPEELTRRNIRSENDIDEDDIITGLIGQNIDVGDHKVYLAGRSDLVLKRLVETGKITDIEKTAALEEIHSIEFNDYHQNIKAPHFVMSIIQQLEDRYGKELVENGGLKVYTTIDPKLQEIAEQAIEKREKGYEEKYNVKNEALVSMNPANGQILAMVGSKDYFSDTIDGKTNIATSYRQHGSTFKPIVYAAAFMNRYSPASIIFDVPTPFGNDWPKNFDGKFQGPISLRKALGQSRNIPAIKAFFLAGEQATVLPFAKKLGVDFLDEERTYGSTMVLGTPEVTLLSMTNAFGTFANAGVHHDPVWILRVENAQGEILEEWKESEGEEAVDPQIAYLITSILSDRTVNVGPNVNVDGQINAAKTGTSNRKNGSQYLPHDLLTLGYTTNLVTGVWAGNNDDSKDGPLNYAADGYNIAAPIFKEFMEKSLAGQPAEEFPIPEGIKQVAVSKYSGKLVSELTPADQQVTDFFAGFAVPTEIDDSYNGLPDFTASETLSSAPCEPGTAQRRNSAILHDIDPSRETWENAAQDWLKENTEFRMSEAGSVTCTSIAPSETPKIEVLNYKDKDVVSDKNLTVQVSPHANGGVKQVLYYLDGQLQYKQDQSPYAGKIRLPKFGGKSSFKLTIRIYDSNANIGETQLTLLSSPESTPTPITEPTSSSGENSPSSDNPGNSGSNASSFNSSKPNSSDPLPLNLPVELPLNLP
ncbi:penicillin-binding protein [Candidatus Peregrinibacteria bacterium]|nr:penicillin-binding protein [Candidatus Peregrinibacteria bacterium]